MNFFKKYLNLFCINIFLISSLAHATTYDYLGFQLTNCVVQAKESSALPSLPDAANPCSIVTEYWFFVVPGGRNQKGYEKMVSNYVVRDGEDFGIGFKFASIKSKVKMQIKFIVPSNPESFKCPTCADGELTVMSDGRTIIVNKDIKSIDGKSAFYWGIDSKDPRGKYQISLALDGVKIKTYDFEVK